MSISNKEGKYSKIGTNFRYITSLQKESVIYYFFEQEQNEEPKKKHCRVDNDLELITQYPFRVNINVELITSI